MKNLAKTLLIGTLALGVFATTASADVSKGQKLYSKKLKKHCSMTGAKMAGKHTQGEWEEMHKAGKLKDEIKSICPSVKDKSLKEKFLPHYFDFFYEYGSDSGNVPSC